MLFYFNKGIEHSIATLISQRGLARHNSISLNPLGWSNGCCMFLCQGKKNRRESMKIYRGLGKFLGFDRGGYEIFYENWNFFRPLPRDTLWPVCKSNYIFPFQRLISGTHTHTHTHTGNQDPLFIECQKHFWPLVY